MMKFLPNFRVPAAETAVLPLSPALCVTGLWRDDGRTIPSNCQMLCPDCNRRKGAK